MTSQQEYTTHYTLSCTENNSQPENLYTYIVG